ncbi:MAG TPA: LysR family transcriptional regulator, partial [Kofleriaceae bacterium]|nr:LysR family transcriptional regulator [Kofleriaceae bacterium]
MQDLAWDDVRVFLAVIRARTAGIAAKSLGVDVSTVSRRLSVLEERLGATLFERGRAGTIAMDAARALVPIAEQMEDAMQRFATAADTLDREIGGVVRIACPADVAEIVVAPLLPALLRAHPALRIDLDAGEAVVDLARREADLALRVVRPQHGDLVVTRLVGVRWVVAGAPHLVRSLGTLRA